MFNISNMINISICSIIMLILCIIELDIHISFFYYLYTLSN